MEEPTDEAGLPLSRNVSSLDGDAEFTTQDLVAQLGNAPSDHIAPFSLCVPGTRAARTLAPREGRQEASEQMTGAVLFKDCTRFPRKV